MRPARENDRSALLKIYNSEAELGEATLDLNTRTLDERREWFFAHQTDAHFILVAEENEKPVGYAPFGFTFCGTLREVGFKHGKYRNIDNFELILGE